MTIENFRGPGTRLSDGDITRTAQMLGVGEDELHAVLEVECSGRGHDSTGRPKMLFEPHVFYRNLSGAKREQAVAAGLAYRAWKPGAYPADSYPRLIAAMQIDEEAALRSASWGMPQLLGENYAMVGYSSAKAMVEAFVQGGEPTQLDAMARFIRKKGLDKALQDKDWAAFAKGYNGASYAKHGYHTKLAKAYRRWAGIPDTPLGDKPAPKPQRRDPVPTPANDPVPVPVPTEFNNDQVRALQERLRALGYFEVGKIDGMWGTRTIGALAAFQAHEGLTPNVGLVPTLDPATLTKLAIAQPRVVSAERKATTADDLRAQGSTVVKQADGINWAQWLQIGMAVLECIVIAWQNYAANPLPMGIGLVMQMAGSPAWLLPIAQFGFALYTRIKANEVIMARLNSERSGLHNGEPDPAPSPPVHYPPEPKEGLPNVRAAWPWKKAA